MIAFSTRTVALFGAASLLAVHAALWKRRSRAAQTLEGENARLTAENEELRRALSVARAAAESRARRAEHANRLSLLGTMLAQVAHEINNPLTFVLLNLPRVSHLLPPGGDVLAPVARAEILGILGDMEEGAERIQALARELKAFSARELGPRVLVDLQAAVRASLRMLAGSLPAYVNVSEHHDGAPSVLAARARLMQIVLNLVKNAAQAASPVARCMVTVRTGTTAKGQAFLRVEDDGPGIPEDVLDRVFDPFFTTRADAGGTGLGLAICREIAAELQGTIEVQSRPGRTVFEVCLPPGGAPPPQG